MPRGNWRVLVAFAGLIFLCGAQQPDKGQSAQAAASDASQQVAKAHSVTPTAETVAAPSPTPDLSKPAHDESYYDREDLKAQRSMADWTRYMGIAAVVGVILSIVGVGLVYTTFKETRHANTIAREALEGQLRPWIDFEVKPFGELEVVNGNLELTGATVFENIGGSPAIGLTYMPTMIFGEDVDPHFYRLIEKFDTTNADWADKNLFPGKNWQRKTCAVHTGERNGPTKITYVVIARYCTPFSKKYRFTAKAYDVQLTTRDAFNQHTPEGPLIDLRNRPIGAETVMLHERQQFAGFAT